MNKFFENMEGGTVSRRIKRALHPAYDPYIEDIRLAAQLRNGHAGHLAQRITTTAQALFYHIVDTQGTSSAPMRRVFDRSDFTLRNLYSNVTDVIKLDHSTLTKLRDRLAERHALEENEPPLTQWGGEVESWVEAGLTDLPAAEPDLGPDAWVQEADMQEVMDCFPPQEQGFGMDNGRWEDLKNSTLAGRDAKAGERVDGLVKDVNVGGVLASLLELRERVDLGEVAGLSETDWQAQLLDELAEKTTTLWATAGQGKFFKAFEKLFSFAIDRAMSDDPTIHRPTNKKKSALIKEASEYVNDLVIEVEVNEQDGEVNAMYGECVVHDALDHLREVAVDVADGVINAAAGVVGEIAATLRNALLRWETFAADISLQKLLHNLGHRTGQQQEEGGNPDLGVAFDSKQGATFALLAGLLGVFEQGSPLPAECKASSTCTLLPTVGTVYIRDGRPGWRRYNFLFKMAPEVFRQTWSHFLKAARGEVGHDGQIPARFLPLSLLRSQITKHFNADGFKRMLALRSFHRQRMGTGLGNGMLHRHQEYGQVLADVNPLRPPLSMQWVHRDLHGEQGGLRSFGRDTSDFLVVPKQSTRPIYGGRKCGMGFLPFSSLTKA